MVGVRLNLKLAAIQIRDARVNLDVPLQQYIDRGLRTVHRRDAPASLNQVDRVASGPAREIERYSRGQIGREACDQWRGSLKELLAIAITLVPFLNAQLAVLCLEAALKTLLRIRTPRSISFSVMM